MPSTTPHGVPYPLGTDPVADGDDAIKALAENLDPVAAVTQAALTLPAGVSATSTSMVFRRGRSVHMLFDLSYAGGGIGPGGTLATVPAGFPPIATWQLLGYVLTTATIIFFNVNTDGRIVPANQSIATGWRMLTSTSWPITPVGMALAREISEQRDKPETTPADEEEVEER